MKDGTGKLPTLDSHVDNEHDTKTMIYNRKRNKKVEGQEKRKKKKEVEENTTVKRKKEL